jgi:hypothetical protein
MTNETTATLAAASRSPTRSRPASALLNAILWGGLIVGVLDAVDALVAFKLVAGFDPIPIYQFVASGLLGPEAFKGGLATAGLGLLIHFLIAFGAAAVYVGARASWRFLPDSVLVAGSVYGVGVYAFMNYVVIPLSRIPSSPFSLPLFLNGVIGHALLVGVPIAYLAREVRPAGRS